MEDKQPFTPHSNFYKIFVVQITVVIIILAGVLTLKYVSPANYEKIKKFYESTFAVDTTIGEVLAGER